MPEIINGQNYTVTLVFDNRDDNTAINQLWIGAHLTCTIWRMNNTGNVVFAQDLVARPPTVVGTTTTNAVGALTSLFSEVRDSNIPTSAYTSNGIALTAPVHWFANSANPVFSDSTGGGPPSFRDPTGIGGVQMNIANWSAPQPFSGPCSAFASPEAATAVPTLGEWTMALLGLATAVVGARRLRRHSRQTGETGHPKQIRG
ncbi:IPTL-CTERM sorting domain-containing protein [Acidovorax sp. ACV01]|uniref:IPTL-CTERM sorting domain-containing protein n=1 Tax=Acidovorax sp. ACV01 TaxID=2769311 RepID=UPI001783B024|nr:IPTL-CTERM sorting domain-containing protein [Acidovorax sp. ACV01]MBD9392308.1 IPTL-CTERM sorting domain-containing protein [Acidovorax sp. ACV01]